MSEPLTAERLAELKAAVIPYLDPSRIEFAERDDPDQVAAALAYLTENHHKFVDPFDDKCIGCGHLLRGLLGSFTWGMIHGEGSCAHCGWPARAYHFYEYEGRELRFVAILQYHPDGIEVRG